MLSKKLASINTPLAYHGAIDFAELETLGLQPDDILDFSVNSNPYGPSPNVQLALSQTPLDRYPDREVISLRRALARRLNVSVDQIVMGNGAAELLWLIALAFLRPKEQVLVVGPTFGEYERLSHLMGGHVTTWQASPDDYFKVNVDVISNFLTNLQPAVTFICNPNNPTGAYLPVDIIGHWAKSHPETLFVIDEAYLAFSSEAESILKLKFGNLLAVRSMTKDYALAGLRLGYAVSHNPKLISAINLSKPAWNVNALAQVAGLAALADESHQQHTLLALKQSATAFVNDLTAVGFAPIPSTTHFFLLPITDNVLSVHSGSEFRSILLKYGILVRDCTSFGLPSFVRIATRRPNENKQLLEKVQNLIVSREIRI